MTALLLLAPATPMLFQGQEFASTSPFVFFASHRGELARLVAEGRKRFLANFSNLATPEMQRRIPDPALPDTFLRCKLDWSEATRNLQAMALHRDLLRLRRTDAVLSRQSAHLDGAVLSETALVIRFFDATDQDRLLLVNLGRDLNFAPIAEPLLAEPSDCQWRLLWSSEHPRFGGQGTAPMTKDDGWILPGQTTVLFAASPVEESGDD